MTRIRLVDPRDPREAARGEAFVAERASTPFHRPAWLTAIAAGTRQTPLALVAESAAGALTGWLPLVAVRHPLFPATLVSSGFGVGGGPLADDEATALALCRAAEELAQRQSCTSVEIRGGAAPDDWMAVTGKHSNFARPLAENDEAELLGIVKRARAEVRKGLANPLEITVGRDAAALDAFFGRYADSVHNLGTPVFPKALFARVIEAFGENADIITAWHQGRPVSSVVSLYHQGTVMPYWGGGGAKARGLRANERVYYELMNHARRRGMNTFDFGRSKEGSGPYRFKKLWGFEPAPLTYHVWTAPGEKARNIDPTDAGYSAKIELWKRLPLSIATRIGPHIARGLG